MFALISMFPLFSRCKLPGSTALALVAKVQEKGADFIDYDCRSLSVRDGNQGVQGMIGINEPMDLQPFQCIPLKLARGDQGVWQFRVSHFWAKNGSTAKGKEAAPIIVVTTLMIRRVMMISGCVTFTILLKQMIVAYNQEVFKIYVIWKRSC